jgi:hypothetical protein
MYGMLGKLPDRGIVRDALLDFMDGIEAMADAAIDDAAKGAKP